MAEYNKLDNSSSAFATLQSDVLNLCANQSQQFRMSMEKLSDSEWYLRTAVWVFLGFMILLFSLISIYCIQILKEETEDFEDDWEEEEDILSRGNMENSFDSTMPPSFVRDTDNSASKFSSISIQKQVSAACLDYSHAATLNQSIFHMQNEKRNKCFMPYTVMSS